MIVKVESGVDGILVDDQAIWLDVVGSHKVVALHAVLIVVTVLAVVSICVASELFVMVAG